jgi:hypothetical protein
MSGVVKELWKNAPDEHDFPASADYLRLLMPEAAVNATIKALRKAPLTQRKAKDLLRASRLPILSPDNVHVRNDLGKIAHGVQLSPVMLVRGNLEGGWPLQIADGYHRVCASFHVAEDADIPCLIVDARLKTRT